MKADTAHYLFDLLHSITYKHDRFHVDKLEKLINVSSLYSMSFLGEIYFMETLLSASPATNFNCHEIAQTEAWITK